MISFWESPQVHMSFQDPGRGHASGFQGNAGMLEESTHVAIAINQVGLVA